MVDMLLLSLQRCRACSCSHEELANLRNPGAKRTAGLWRQATKSAGCYRDRSCGSCRLLVSCIKREPVVRRRALHVLGSDSGTA